MTARPGGQGHTEYNVLSGAFLRLKLDSEEGTTRPTDNCRSIDASVQLSVGPFARISGSSVESDISWSFTR